MSTDFQNPRASARGAVKLRDSRDRAAAWAHSVLDEARDGGHVQSLSGGIAAAIEGPRVAA